jgi:hypothetical protein
VIGGRARKVVMELCVCVSEELLPQGRHMRYEGKSAIRKDEAFNLVSRSALLVYCILYVYCTKCL